MPAWNKALADEDIWKITAFLTRLDKLPPAVQDNWEKTYGVSPKSHQGGDTHTACTTCITNDAVSRSSLCVHSRAKPLMREQLDAIFDTIKDAIIDSTGAREPWKPISRPAVIAWLVFYVAFLAYAFSKHGEFLFIDSANLVVHEGGHALFGWFGPTIGLWGGTILQWLVPFLLAGLFLPRASARGFRVLSFLLFRKLDLHRHVYGGRDRNGPAAGHPG